MKEANPAQTNLEYGISHLKWMMHKMSMNDL